MLPDAPWSFLSELRYEIFKRSIVSGYEINMDTDTEYDPNDHETIEEQLMMVRTNEVGEEVVNYYLDYQHPMVDLEVTKDGRFILIDEDAIKELNIPKGMEHMDVIVRGRNYVIYYNNYQEYKIVGPVKPEHFETMERYKEDHGSDAETFITDHNYYENYEMKIMRNWRIIPEDDKIEYLEYFQYCRDNDTEAIEEEMNEKLMNRKPKSKKRKKMS